MSRARWLLSAVALLVSGEGAEATTIDFDDVATGTTITNQYASLGVTFSTSTAFSNGEESSAPNFIIGQPSSFDPITMDFSAPVALVDMILISVGHGQVTATAYSADLVTVLDSVSIQNLGGPVDGFGNHDPISLAGSGIARVFVRYTLAHPGDGFGIDDVSFSLPEPATLLMLAPAFAALAWWRVRRGWR